ncbi:pilus assembly protein TadG-related protein [Novosphingobium sp. H3SJ31-1]|uniref:Pilus assembly protein TadG-related protein n=2 Tax=Novosphingobium album (ex Liu et al. 2023) TaxID=3031130 RepID=A0ABT5WPT8_9SPHN|nr:pilus assembly protein TadG-related protein [Novosphingobium album (ex Liu et al. 2023)]
MWGDRVKAIVRRVRPLAGDVAGNVLPLAAVGFLMLAALIGGGLDMSRGYMAQSKLQEACDAGVLAARKAVGTNGFDSTVRAAGEKFFDANFDDDDQKTRNTSFATVSDDNGLTINGTARTTLDSVVMRIFAYNEFDLTTKCTASMGVGNSDVTFVLDTTGSMAWTAGGSNPRSGQTSRIQDLQAAMKNFYTTLKNASAGSNARIRYGFVPYSSSVNVGRLIVNLDPSYLVDSMTIQSRRGVATWKVTKTETESGSGQTTYDAWAKYKTTSYNSLSACQAKQPADDTTWSNYGSPRATTTTTYDENGNKIVESVTTQTKYKAEYTCTKSGSKYYVYDRNAYQDFYNGTVKTSQPIYSTGSSDFTEWMYRPITYDVSNYKLFNTVRVNNASNGGSASYTWNGCIEERETSPESTFAYSPLTGMSPDTWDLNIDDAPDGSDESKWRPMWPQVAYDRLDDAGNMTMEPVAPNGRQADSYCPKAAQLLAEMTQSDFNAYVNGLSPDGSTYHDLGMLWGARISSPTGMWQDNVNAEPSNGGTVSRHILFMTDGEMDNNVSIQTMYGIEFYDRRITTDGTKPASDARHTARFLALCEAAKAKGIRVWVIAFGTSLTGDLKTCSSDNSAYTAASSSQLNAAFQEIAKQVGELRITQ